MTWQRRLALQATNRKIPSYLLVATAVFLPIIATAVDWHSAHTRNAAFLGFLAAMLVRSIDTRALREIIDEQSSVLPEGRTTRVPAARPLSVGEQITLVLVGVGAPALVWYAAWHR
jgi:hypothetical protein